MELKAGEVTRNTRKMSNLAVISGHLSPIQSDMASEGSLEAEYQESDSEQLNKDTSFGGSSDCSNSTTASPGRSSLESEFGEEIEGYLKQKLGSAQASCGKEFSIKEGSDIFNWNVVGKTDTSEVLFEIQHSSESPYKIPIITLKTDMKSSNGDSAESKLVEPKTEKNWCS